MLFSIDMRNILVSICLLLSFQLSAQKATLLDADSGIPISNAAIYNSDKSKTTISDFNGWIDLLQFGKNEKIFIKHLSYQTVQTTKFQILKRGGYVYMETGLEQLDEIVMSVSKWEQQKKL